MVVAGAQAGVWRRESRVAERAAVPRSSRRRRAGRTDPGPEGRGPDRLSRGGAQVLQAVVSARPSARRARPRNKRASLNILNSSEFFGVP